MSPTQHSQYQRFLKLQFLYFIGRGVCVSPQILHNLYKNKMSRADMRLDDVKWEEVKVVSEVPKGALEPTQIPDCVFPQCGETHRDGESGTCRMCGRRTTAA